MIVRLRKASDPAETSSDIVVVPLRLGASLDANALSARHASAILRGSTYLRSVPVAKFDRITCDPAILNGQPTIRGMRLTVRRVIEALVLYPNWDDLRVEYPELDPEDIRQALEFAAQNLDDHVLPLEAA